MKYVSHELLGKLGQWFGIQKSISRHHLKWSILSDSAMTIFDYPKTHWSPISSGEVLKAVIKLKLLYFGFMMLLKTSVSPIDLQCFLSTLWYFQEVSREIFGKNISLFAFIPKKESVSIVRWMFCCHNQISIQNFPFLIVKKDFCLN